MDPFFFKALSDQAAHLPQTEDAFYTQHSCLWLQRLKRVLLDAPLRRRAVTTTRPFRTIKA